MGNCDTSTTVGTTAKIRENQQQHAIPRYKPKYKLKLNDYDFEFLVHAFVAEFTNHTRPPQHVPTEVITLIIQFCSIHINPVVIDNGSYQIKTGFAGDNVPLTFPSIVARPTAPSHTLDLVIGNQMELHSDLSLTYPIQNGMICNWNDIHPLWDYTFDELRLKPDGLKVIMTEPAEPMILDAQTNVNRERMTQIMFETYNVEAFYIAVSEVLALYASGRTTGVVCSSGHTVTNMAPIRDGNVVRQAVVQCNKAGRDVTEYLQRILSEKGYSFATKCEQQIVNDIKEKLCYVTMYYEHSMANRMNDVTLEQDYALPDGTVITVDTERFRAPEFMFVDGEEIHKLLYESIMKCGPHIRSELYRNIVLCGGNTMFDGMAGRLKREMRNLAPNNQHIQVISPPDRNHSGWIGASMLASSSTFEFWMTREEYDEHGSQMIPKKFHAKLTKY